MIYQIITPVNKKEALCYIPFEQITKFKMHIPNQMLEGAVCPITTTAAVIGVGAAAYFAYKSKEKPTARWFSAIAAFIFAAQMMNFPIQNGTSGHLIGAVLAVALLGLPFGILAMTIVLTIQCLVFADGGTAMLGANILNMAIIGSLAGLIIHRKNSKKYLTLGLAAFGSVIFAALACSVELWLTGTIELTKVLPAMLSVHAIIGIGEATITVAAYMLFKSKKTSYALPLIAAGATSLFLSPFASGFPDGLEWVATKYNFLHIQAANLIAPLPNYSVPFINNELIAISLAGFIGVTITFLATWGIGKTLNIKANEI